MSDPLNSLRSQLATHGQSHLLGQWARLDASQRDHLTAQLNELDFELLAELAASGFDESAELEQLKSLGQRAEPPPALRLTGNFPGFTREEAFRAGEQAVASGKTAMMIVAGGLGTRLGFDQPKGLFPLGPLSRRTLFQILLEQVLAISRAHDISVPLYIMTSPATHAVTEQFLRENKNFGLPAEDVQLFCQSTLWALDLQTNRLLLETPGSLFLGPDGHGGMLQAFARSGALADAQRRGIEHLCYGQIDNPLTAVCDPLLVGGHILARSEMTTQVVAKREPFERVGNVVSVDGQMHMIEYIHLPPEIAQQTNRDGNLKFWAGNVAVHVFDLNFLQRMSQSKSALPLHWAKKKVPFVNEQGATIEPEQPNAWRFERFIFDLLPQAKNALVVEAEREDIFAPVKNAAGERNDTARTAQELMSDLYKRWLREAGADVAADVIVEINPLFARNARELAGKIPRDLKVHEDRYFAPAR